MISRKKESKFLNVSNTGSSITPVKLNFALSSLNSSDDNNADQDKRNGKKTKREETPFDLEIARLKSTATDFKLRFCGHCNTTTDIKEANFFGRYVDIFQNRFLKSISYIDVF